MYLKVMDQQQDGAFTILRVGARITTGRPPEGTFVAVTHEFQDSPPESPRYAHWLNPDTGFMEGAVFPSGSAFLMSDTGKTIDRF